MTRPVFLATGLEPSAHALSVGDHATLSGDEGRHASVMRIAVGEQIDVCDGGGLRLTCTAAGSSKNSIDLTVDAVEYETQPQPRLTLVQALAKGGRDEQAIETATEIGIDRVIAWESNRSIVRWAGSKKDKGIAKWASVLAAATKQARRAYIPTMLGCMNTKDLTNWVRATVEGGGLVFVCHEEATRRLSTYLRAHTDELKTLTDCVCIVGPEGGIAPEELAGLVEAGAQPVLLGPHVLRSSTAGSAAASIISTFIGRW